MTLAYIGVGGFMGPFVLLDVVALCVLLFWLLVLIVRVFNIFASQVIAETVDPTGGTPDDPSWLSFYGRLRYLLIFSGMLGLPVIGFIFVGLPASPVVAGLQALIMAVVGACLFPILEKLFK